MFRLVKVLNGNSQCEIVRLKYNESAVIGRGCALSNTSSGLNSPTNTGVPEYISLSGNEDVTSDKIDVIVVTEDMVFKVEYVGSMTPTMGMSVGLATNKYKMDSVTYNSSGKGTVLGIEDDKSFVYVRFRK